MRVVDYLKRYFLDEKVQEAAIPGMGIFYVDRKKDSIQILFKEKEPNSEAFVDYVAKTTKQKKDNIRQAIKLWVEEIRNELRTKKTALVGDIGSFEIKDRKVVFVPAKPIELKKDETAVSDKVAASAAAPVSKPASSAAAKTASAPTAAVEPAASVAASAAASVGASASTGSVQKTAEETPKTTAEAKPGSASATAAIPAEAPKPVAATGSDLPQKASKKSKSPLAIIVVLIILLGLGAASYFLFVKQGDKPKTESIKLGVKPSEDILDMEEAAEEAENEAIEQAFREGEELKRDALENTVNLEKGKYYVVVGCFAVEANAHKVYGEVKNNREYSAKIVFDSNLNNYKVSLKDFDSRERAMEFRNKMAEKGENVWIYTKEK